MTELQVQSPQTAAPSARAHGHSPKLDLRCGECGYGVVVAAAPMRCPMCGCATWEHAPWRPFAASVAH